MTKISILLIRFYQKFSRNIFGYNIPVFIFASQCRFYPSCSEYAIESISRYGFWSGSGKSLVRILQCNPLYGSKR